MDHFKKLNNAAEAGDVSNDNVIGAAEKFFAQTNYNELNYEFSDQELSLLIAKLNNNKVGGIDWIRNEFLKKAAPNLITFICNLF